MTDDGLWPRNFWDWRATATDLWLKADWKTLQSRHVGHSEREEARAWCDAFLRKISRGDAIAIADLLGGSPILVVRRHDVETQPEFELSRSEMGESEGRPTPLTDAWTEEDSELESVFGPLSLRVPAKSKFLSRESLLVVLTNFLLDFRCSETCSPHGRTRSDEAVCEPVWPEEYSILALVPKTALGL